MDAPTYTIVAGPYSARVRVDGARLVSLTRGGRELVFDRSSSVPRPGYQGAVLVPWPNRIRDGAYAFAGERHQLAITEPARGTALHGLALWQRWQVDRSAPDAITLSSPIVPRPGYPFALDVRVEYRIDECDGLAITVMSLNVGTGPAPYGASIHPYLTAGGVLDDWYLRLPAREVLTVDDRLLPVGARDVAGSEFDYRSPRQLREAVIDHAFGRIDFSVTGEATAALVDARGDGVRISWDERCPWVQVYTLVSDRDDLDRRAVAIEPMTCPPDAFNSGDGLIVLEPGKGHRAHWRIAAISG